MRAERQSLHLQNMMQKHKRYPEYELVLPSFAVKKKSLKSLASDDLLLLEMERLDLALVLESQTCAKVRLTFTGDTLKLKIVSLEKSPVEKSDSKKYENILCSFGQVQSRVLELGHIIEIPALNMEKVEVGTLEKKIAKGRLVLVDDKLAIKITEVEHG